MQIKKYPNALLENYSRVFIQLGLVLSLFIVYEFLQMKSYPREVKELVGTLVAIDDSEQIVEFKPIEIEIKKTTQKLIPDRILKVDNEVEIEESIIESTETDESQAVVVDENVVENIVDIEEEEVVVEDVPFMIIEKVPIFPGCSGNNNELRDCFSTQISKFVASKFNADLASDLGLDPGSIQRIFVIFKIDKNGNIVDIKARAPHIRLQEEAIRVVSLLPKMTPGKQRGRPVGVKYSLPITFQVR